MPRGSSSKRERQYEHIKDSYEQRGQGRRAEEIAARTVNKDRAEAGETKKSRSPSSRSTSQAKKQEKPGASRGTSRSGRGSGDRTHQQLYEQARRKGIAGRSTMNKAQLEKAVAS